MSQNVTRTFGLLAALAALTVWASHPTTPSGLQQKYNGSALAIGATVPTGVSVELTADSQSGTCDSSTPTYQLEFEIRPTTSAFTNTPTHFSPLMAKPSCVLQTYPDTSVTLNSGTYKWQVREKASTGTGSWVMFNGGLAAFTVAPPNVPDILVKTVALSSVNSTSTQLDFVVNATFENRGTVATGNFTWNAYLSTDKQLQVGTDTLIYSSTTAISVGATTTLTDSSTLISLNPRPAPGQYYVVVEADPAPQGCTTNCGTVSEFDETNNVGSMANYFVSGVDMVATSISNGPATTGPGQTISLTVNFYNQGVDNPLPSQTVEFRIVASRDQNVSADDYEVYRNSVTVNGPTNINMPVSVTLPSGVAGGPVYWGLQVDPDNKVTNEASRGNNAVISSATTHVQQADLSADFADMVDVVTGQPVRLGDLGFPARFRVRATNLGDFAAPPHKVGVVISKDNNLSLLVDYVFADVDVQGLAVGTANTVTHDLTVTLPTKDREINGNPLPTGDYYIFLMLDSFNVINELNEANNTMIVQGPIRLRTPAADYATLRVQAPATAAAGETIAIQRTFKNVGTDGGPQTEYACYASANADIRPTDFQLSFVGSNGTTSQTRIIQLAAGEADSTTEWVRLPGTIPAGNYYVGCIIDPANMSAELDEVNNTFASPTVTQVAGQSFRITTAQIPDGIVNLPYQFRLSTTPGAGPVTWSVVGMGPEGLTVGATDGTLVGTPTTLGIQSIRVQATDGRAVSEAVLSLRILPPTTQLTITTDKLPPLTNSAQLPYQAALSAVGDSRPYIWEIVSGTLPSGISLDPATGVISGSPRSGIPNGETKLTVQVRGKLGAVVRKELSLRTVPPGALTIITLALPDAMVSQDYITDLAATLAGSTTVSRPLSWRVVSGTMPLGLNLATHSDQSTGLITGKPSQSGTFPFTVQVTDAENRVDTTSFVLRIHPNALKVTLQAPPPEGLRPGATVDLTVISTGIGGAKFRVFAGALPPGLSLNEEGRVTGTLEDGTSVGTWNFTVEAVDATGAKGLGAFSIDVLPPQAAQGCSSTAGASSLLALLALGVLLARRRATATRKA